MCRRVLPLLLCVAKGAPLLLCVRRVLSLLLQVPQNQPNYFPSIDGTQDSMYIPVPQDEPYYFPCMDGTHDSMQGLAQYKWRTILEVHPILDQEWSTI
ncbi:uncharacterized protein LOC114257030 isoform X4 [Camellia sinensis]|uniref:uncharacterized protein LOC114257030 isoform X4 n=1 Tax=Camellia sinensis TaxID=4442 RepID=UPI00103550C9|nr:uncharacterized protein LOC114257030 isoform X4 [Camellia sinensis]